MPVYLWLMLCLNDTCTSSNVYRYETYTGATKTITCRADERDMIRQLKQKHKTGKFHTACKTQAKFEKEGL
jgi:hypothetical protein